jgi:hypothetical protein
MSASVAGESGDVRWRTDRHGFRRAGDATIEKPEGTRRVLLVGDSFAVGYRVGQADDLGSRLQQALGEAGAPVEVLAAGAGYPSQAARVVASRLRFAPDLVVLGLTLGNDLQQELFETGGPPRDAAQRLLLGRAAFRSSPHLFAVRLDRTLRAWRMYRELARLSGYEPIASWNADRPLGTPAATPPRRGRCWARSGACWRRVEAIEVRRTAADGRDLGANAPYSPRAFFRISGAEAPKYFTARRLQVGVRRTLATYSSSTLRSCASSWRTP